MTLRECKELKELADKAGLTTNQVSEIIITELINNKLIEDSPENWGNTIFDAIEAETTVGMVADCVDAMSKKMNCDVLFLKVVEFDLIGNDDCPECGGEMEVTNGEYKQTGGDGYTTPPEYTPTWETKKCSNCGHEESNEPSY